MTKPTLELPPAAQNEARLAQLRKTLQPQILELLQSSRQDVSEFLRLGRKWGFFALDQQTSGEAGREVLMNAHMPESNLAALIGGRDPQSLSVLESTIDEGLVQDPKYLAKLLISRIDGLYQKEARDHGTVALTAGDAAKILEGETQAEKFLGCVDTPAPIHAVPEWFAVMKNLRLGPQDLEMIYEIIDQQNSDSSEARVEQVLGDEHDAVLDVAKPAA